MTGIEPQLWAERAGSAVAFYEQGLGATALVLVGEGEDVVARLQVGDARFWVGSADPSLGRLSPTGAGGTTSRTLLVVDDPEAVVRRAVDAGAMETAPVADEHGWRVGRITDPSGHEWEIGRPPG